MSKIALIDEIPDEGDVVDIYTNIGWVREVEYMGVGDYLFPNCHSFISIEDGEEYLSDEWGVTHWRKLED